MKWNKSIAALLLSAALLAGAAAPSFAEPETASQTPAAVQQTAEPAAGNDTAAGQTDGTQKTDTAKSEPEKGNSNPTSPQKQNDVVTEMPTIDINAKASILVNAETGEIVHANNEHEQLYPASCTKIMTALLALEKCGLDDVVTMQEEDFKDVKAGASSAGLKIGEQITVENLLYCLLLPSGNEAANALARTAGGSVDEFVQMMNDRAKELGCTNTHFVNPNGLHNDNHYTSAYDLYLIAREAMKNSTFATVVNTAQKKLPATNMNAERIIYSTNHLILSSFSSVYYDNCYGIKTGHTTPAGYCLVSFAKSSGYTYYSVVLGAKAGAEYAGSFTETKRMFEWAFQKFRMQTATEAGAAVTECPVRLGRGTDHVTLVTANDVPVLVPSGVDMDQLTVDISTEESYDAPIAKGEKLGTVTYSFDGMKCATADLVSLTEVKRSPVLYALDLVEQFFHLTPVRIVLGIVSAAFVLYLILSFIAGRNRRRRKRQRRRQKNNRH